MMQPITHGESQWRRLCGLLGVDPDVATVDALVIKVRRKVTPKPPLPVTAHIAGAPILAGATPVVTTTTDALRQDIPGPTLLGFPVILADVAEPFMVSRSDGKLHTAVLPRFEPYCEGCGKPPMVCRCGEGEEA